MFCPNCGAASDASAAYCGACGARLATASPPSVSSAPAEPAQERELQRFGAFGVGITFGRPSLWRWTKFDMIEIVLTDRRVCGVWNPSISRTFVSARRGQLFFQVPLADVVAMEPLKFLGKTVVWLKWRDGAGFKEVSIQGSLGKGPDVTRLHHLIEDLLKARPPAA
jgi:hypothetical protein